MTIRTRLILVFFAILTLGACASSGSGYNLPAATATGADRSLDAIAVDIAVQQLLRGADLADMQGISLAANADVQIGEKDFKYGGFGVKKSSVLRYVSPADADNARTLAGQLDFEDAIGRKTSVLYIAQYHFVDGSLVIDQASAATLYSTFPDVRMYVVPAEAVMAAPGGLPQTHSGLLEFVLAEGVRWGPSTPVPPGINDYVVFIFLKDRVSPSAKITLKISKNRPGHTGYKDSSHYMDVQGWRVGMLTGSFALDSKWPLYVKMVFRPGQEVSQGDRYERLVGLFSADINEAE